MELQVSPESVLIAHSNASREVEVLIHWHDIPISKDFLYLFSLMQQQFPSFHFEDKVSLLGEEYC